MKVNVNKLNFVRWILFVLVITISISAQERKAGNKLITKTDRLTKQMGEDLGLTQDQISKLELINSEYFQKMDELMNSNIRDAETQKKTRKKIRKEWHDNIKSILTPEQGKMFKSFLDEKRSERKDKSGSKEKSPQKERPEKGRPELKNEK